MTGRGHYWVSSAVLLAVVLNILLTVYHAGQLTQQVTDLSQRVARLESVIDSHFIRADPPADRHRLETR